MQCREQVCAGLSTRRAQRFAYCLHARLVATQHWRIDADRPCVLISRRLHNVPTEYGAFLDLRRALASNVEAAFAGMGERANLRPVAETDHEALFLQRHAARDSECKALRLGCFHRLIDGLRQRDGVARNGLVGQQNDDDPSPTAFLLPRNRIAEHSVVLFLTQMVGLELWHLCRRCGQMDGNQHDRQYKSDCSNQDARVHTLPPRMRCIKRRLNQRSAYEVHCFYNFLKTISSKQVLNILAQCGIALFPCFHVVEPGKL